MHGQDRHDSRRETAVDGTTGKPESTGPAWGSPTSIRAAATAPPASAAVSGQAMRADARRPGVPAVALTIAWITIVEAARGKLAWLVAGFLVAGCTLALFAGAIAITESQGFRAGILGAWLRSCAVFTVGLSIIASVAREFHDKGIELLLSLPVPRAAYYGGKLAGFAGISILSALACSLALAWFAPLAQVAIWGACLALELIVVASMSLLCVITFAHVTLASSVSIAIYLLSRAMAAIQLMAHEPPGVPETAASQFIRVFVDALAFIVPDLDRFTESAWLVYGSGTVADLGFAAMQSGVYLTLLCAAGMFDLYRKAL